MMPTAAMLLIGNELLSGRTQDKNLAYIAGKLAQIGIRMMEARVIPDVETTIIETLNTLRAQYTYVFTSGGIGPTHDDITSASIAKAFGVPLVRHPDAEAALRAYYPPEKINAARLKMADVPEGATLIPNALTAAPGFVKENVYVLAGVPSICQAMMEAVRPSLKGGAPIQSRSVTINLGEGQIAEALTEIQRRNPAVEIGSYPQFNTNGPVSVQLVAKGVDAEIIATVIEAIRAMVAANGGVVLQEE